MVRWKPEFRTGIFDQRLLCSDPFGATLDLYQRAMASVRVFGLLDTQTAIVGGEHAPEKVEGGVELKDVSFAYPDREPILQDFSLSIPAVRRWYCWTHWVRKIRRPLITAILRSTVRKITLDSTGLKEWELDTSAIHRSCVSIGLSLDGSIWDNILYGRPDATEKMWLPPQKPQRSMSS